MLINGSYNLSNTYVINKVYILGSKKGMLDTETSHVFNVTIPNRVYSYTRIIQTWEKNVDFPVSWAKFPPSKVDFPLVWDGFPCISLFFSLQITKLPGKALPILPVFSRPAGLAEFSHQLLIQINV